MSADKHETAKAFPFRRFVNVGVSKSINFHVILFLLDEYVLNIISCSRTFLFYDHIVFNTIDTEGGERDSRRKGNR